MPEIKSSDLSRYPISLQISALAIFADAKAMPKLLSSHPAKRKSLKEQS